ncbi:MAG: hypothetical protein KGV46_00130 [Pasteurella sp.]|nr:hypothetical protein [Pasteurella sp.]
MASYEKVLENIRGLNIVSGALHKDCIYFVAENYYDKKIHGDKYDEWDYPIEIRIYMYVPKLKKVKDEWFAKAYNEVGFLKHVTDISNDIIAFLGVFPEGSLAIQNNVEETSSGFQTLLKIIPVQGAITDVSVIDDAVYATASGGEVYKRISNKEWKEIAKLSTKNFFSNKRSADGFDCIDGFSADEIYAGGEKGTLWLFNKDTWRPIELPSNSDVQQIICAPDGYVYLNMGWLLLKGREDNWEKIKIPKEFKWIDSQIRKITWFKDKLYVLPYTASVYGMAVYQDNDLKAVKVGSFTINPEKIINDNPLWGIETKNMDTNVFIPSGINDMVANDELLMITGNDEVILFNGERWFNLFDKNRSEEELRATGTFYDPREL